MSKMFAYAYSFDQPIEGWDTSNVSDMGGMFYNAASFNKPIGNWNVSNVTVTSSEDGLGMFEKATAFNQPINNWDTSNVTDMVAMFSNASAFNQPLNSWNTSNVTDMGMMFTYATAFNQPIGGWDVSNVVNMYAMFYGATAFNQPIGSWDVHNVDTVSMFYEIYEDEDGDSYPVFSEKAGMFEGAISFNQDLENWDLGKVLYTCNMFKDATSFNGNISGWDVSKVRTMENMFDGAFNFNQPIDNWDVGDVLLMNSMFKDAYSFDQSLNSWDVSNVIEMRNMFENATAFNGNIMDWDVSSVTNMYAMFYNASSFNGVITDWDVHNVEYVSSFPCYPDWFDSEAEICDDGIKGMFEGAISFNKSLRFWDVSKITSMSQMFKGATSFGASVQNWDVSNVTDMSSMFSGVQAFRSPLSDWDVSNVTDMTDMFLDTKIPRNLYNDLLTHWDALDLQPGVNFNAGNSICCTGQTARDHMTSSDNWVITDGGVDCGLPYFITMWDTVNGDTTIEIPTFPGETYLYDVDWNDDDTWETGFTGNATHDYETAGNHTVRIRGTFPRIYFNNSGDKEKIKKIMQWGTQVWSSMGSAFFGCKYLDQYFTSTIDPPDLSNVTDMSYMFSNATYFDGKVNNWDTSNVTNMSHMFSGVRASNLFIDDWDVSNVTNMESMFFSSNFNQEIGGWNTSSVTNMREMFSYASYFNQEIGEWNTSNVTDMSEMFSHAEYFNKSINSWDTSAVTNMKEMFSHADSFNQEIGGWNTSNVTDMSGMFSDTEYFNKSIDTWDTANVTDMSDMFSYAKKFNKSLNSWDTSNVTNMESMFNRAYDFNQSIGDWDTSSVTNMHDMFNYADDFNQPIGNWDTSNVTDMSNMFNSAFVFNQPIGSWDVGHVVNMTAMFKYANAFDSPIDSWDVSSVVSMERMFEANAGFNQPIGSWDVSNVTNMGGMFYYAHSFNQPLNNWDTSNVTTFYIEEYEEPLGIFGYAKAFNQPLDNWDVSNVTNMSHTFIGAEAFNQSIGSWDVSNVTDMSYMFYLAYDFNQPIGNWNVGNVTDMSEMFLRAEDFNQPIGNWNVGNVTDMSEMFLRAEDFNQPIGNWDVSNVTSMPDMFYKAYDFDQDIGDWNVSNVTSMDRMFSYVTLSSANYDALLIGWNDLDLQPNVHFSGGYSKYCDGNDARTNMIDSDGWSISDAGMDSSCPDYCAAPSDLTASSITISGADLSWTENGTATTWDLEIGLQGFAPTGTPTADDITNPYTWSDAAEDTSYDYYVRADCGGDNTAVSDWVGPYSFTTLSSTCSVCASQGNTEYQTSTTRVQLGTIDNVSGKTAYSDYTAISTDLETSTTYDLSVQVNTDGDYTVYTKVWIDWNQNCDFNDAGEEYDLGSANNVSDGATTNSPLSLTVPAGAILGNTTMRVASKYDAVASSCETGFDGEVEDYTINVIEVPCLAPSNVLISEITSNAALISWTENGTATEWDILSVDQFETTIHTTVTENPYTLTGLLSNTSYSIYVSATCSATSSSTYSDAVLFSTAVNYCGDHYYDDGGDSVNYSNNLDDITTIYPDTTGEFVTVTFNSFDVEAGNDSLTIYDGEDTSGTNLGSFDGTTLPSPFTASNSAGALTFVFHSNSSITGAGWDATIDCGPITCPAPSDLSTSNITYQGADIAWTENGTATNWDLYITDAGTIPEASTPPTVDNHDSLSYTWEGGVENTDYDVWVRSDCGDGDTSDWVGATSFTTVEFCQAPTGLNATSITATSAAISWTNNSGTEGTGLFDVIWGVSNFDINTEGTIITGINATTYTLNPPLTSNTTYDWYVRSQCTGSEVSEWSAVNTFITLCETVTVFPFIETFEDDSTTRDCWSQIEESGTSQWIYATGSSAGSDVEEAHGGSTNMLFDASDFGVGKLVSPPLDLSGLSNPSLSFWFAQEGISTSEQNELKVFYRNDAGNSWVQIGYYPDDISVWTYEKLLLPNPSATYQIAFEATNNLGRSSVLDDIMIEQENCTGIVTRWNGGAWNPGAPDATSSVILNADYDIAINGTFDSCSIVVNTANDLYLEDGDVFNAPDDFQNYGGIYVESGGTFVAPDDFVNDGEIYIESGGSFVQTGTPASITGNGVFTTERITTEYHEYDYTYMASPSATATFQQAFVNSEGVNPNYIWQLNTATFNDGDGDSYDDEGDDWVGVTVTDVVTPGVGYAVLGAAADIPFDPDSLTNFNQDTVEYDGPFNTGDISVTLVGDADADDGFINENLIGNPYPSAIDINVLYSANDAVLGANFYFWTHNTGIGGAGGGYAYSFTNDDYSQWIAGAGGGGVASQSGGDAPTQFVASGQGFIGQAENPGVITFTNAMRVNGSNANFLSPTAEDKDRFWLNMTSDNGDFRQVLVGFYATATDGFDDIFDGPRMPNGNNTDFYSVIGEDDRHFAIQGLQSFNIIKRVILGLEIVQEGSYRIELDDFEGIFTGGQAIYIYDNYTHTYHNLADSSYNFTSEVGEAINDRLEIRFTDDTTGIDEALASSVRMYPNPSKGIFNISWIGSTTASIIVSDLSGKRILYQEVESLDRLHTIDMSNFGTGVYFVKLIVDGAQVVEKIILK